MRKAVFRHPERFMVTWMGQRCLLSAWSGTAMGIDRFPIPGTRPRSNRSTDSSIVYCCHGFIQTDLEPGRPTVFRVHIDNGQSIATIEAETAVRIAQINLSTARWARLCTARRIALATGVDLDPQTSRCDWIDALRCWWADLLDALWPDTAAGLAQPGFCVLALVGVGTLIRTAIHTLDLSCAEGMTIVGVLVALGLLLVQPERRTAPDRPIMNRDENADRFVQAVVRDFFHRHVVRDTP